MTETKPKLTPSKVKKDTSEEETKAKIKAENDRREAEAKEAAIPLGVDDSFDALHTAIIRDTHDSIERVLLLRELGALRVRARLLKPKPAPEPKD